MKSFSVCVFVVMVLVAVQSSHGRYLSRPKRVSDQRLAELETLIALSKYRGMLSTVPVGYGRVDPEKIGRRRRAASQLWHELLDDSDVMTRDDSEELVDEVARPVVERRQTYGEEYQLVKDRRRLDGQPELWGRNAPNI